MCANSHSWVKCQMWAYIPTGARSSTSAESVITKDPSLSPTHQYAPTGWVSTLNVRQRMMRSPVSDQFST